MIQGGNRLSKWLNIIKKYKKFFPTSDLDIMPLLLNDEEKQELEVLYQNLDKINRVTTVFQVETGLSLAQLRYNLDGLIRVFSSMEHYLSNAAIVQSSDFENAIVKCIEGKFLNLTSGVKTSVRSLERPVLEKPPPKSQKLDFVEEILLENVQTEILFAYGVDSRYIKQL